MSRRGVFQLGQFAHLAQVFKHLIGLGLIDGVERKSDMHDDVIAHFRVWHVGKINVLEDAAEIDFAAAGEGIVTADADDFAGDR